MNGEPAYIESIRQYREALERALAVANDPFKAPEQTVATARDVFAAAWAMQVEYAAMMRKDAVKS